MQIAITVDVDMAHYDAGRHFDEIEATFTALRHCLEGFPAVKTTWFMRLDAQIGKVYGSAAYVFEKHSKEIDWLRANGHAIGWQHHAYAYDGARWSQETDETIICDDLRRHGETALKLGLQVTRMGWGFHTNRTMKTLNDMGFRIDSSAIPRPMYRWNQGACDWSTSPQYPYHPSARDYRIPGEPHLAIREVPMTTTAVPMPTDTESGVIRYIELAYDSAVFEKAVASVADMERVVLIFHPYKTVKVRGDRILPACDIGNVQRNLEALCGYGDRFATISETVEDEDRVVN